MIGVSELLKASFFDLYFSITNGTMSSKIYNKGYNLNFEIANFQFQEGDVPCAP